MYSSHHFGRIFWVDDELEFKSCPLNVDDTGDFDHQDYVTEWTDWEGVDYNLLFAIYKCELLNKTQYAGSLSLNDKAHKVTNKEENKMVEYHWDESFYKEIVLDHNYRFPKFLEYNYPNMSDRSKTL